MHGGEFEALYARYEASGKAREVVRARELWNDIIIDAQVETGTPYMPYKDAAKVKSNHNPLVTQGIYCPILKEFCTKCGECR